MNRLKELRQEKKLSQKEIALELQVPLRTYQRWENGESQIKPDKAQQLADHFGVSVGYLLGYGEDRKQFKDEIVYYKEKGDVVFTLSRDREFEKFQNNFIEFLRNAGIVISDEQLYSISRLIADLDALNDQKYWGHTISKDGVFTPERNVSDVIEKMNDDGFTVLMPDFRVQD